MGRPPTGRTKTKAFSFKASPEMQQRLDAAAKHLGIAKTTLFLAAVEAALASIERDDGLVLPVRFHVARIPERSKIADTVAITPGKILSARRAKLSPSAVQPPPVATEPS